MVQGRRAFLAFTAAALAAPLAARAQQRTAFRIGYLANDPDRDSPTFQAFIRAMRELGWREGRNLEILYLSSSGRDALFPQLAKDAVNANVDLIVTTGSGSTRAAMDATARIPIVFGSAANPVEQKFVASLSRPGGNVTGLALLVQELGPKRLQLLKQIVPQGSRFVRVYQSTSIVPIQPQIMHEDDAAARALGVKLEHVGVKSAEELQNTFSGLAQSKVDGIVVTAGSVFVVNRAQIAKLALQYRLPMMCADARFSEAGALASYGENFAARYRRAAFLVDKILRGAKPADIPVEQPIIFELVLNLRTAKAIGISIPPSVVTQSDRVLK